MGSPVGIDRGRDEAIARRKIVWWAIGARLQTAA
jgi:hypothetical protein